MLVQVLVLMLVINHRPWHNQAKRLASAVWTVPHPHLCRALAALPPSQFVVRQPCCLVQAVEGTVKISTTCEHTRAPAVSGTRQCPAITQTSPGTTGTCVWIICLANMCTKLDDAKSFQATICNIFSQSRAADRPLDSPDLPIVLLPDSSLWCSGGCMIFERTAGVSIITLLRVSIIKVSMHAIPTWNRELAGVSW